MRVTPLDILQKQFAAGRRGYDADEVRAFLDEVRESLEEVLRENQSLRDLLLAREKEIATLRENELGIKDTLLLARQLAADVRRAAHKEADVIVGEARLEAEKVIASGHDEQRRTVEQLLRLRALRLQYIAHVRALLRSQDRILAEIESDPTLPALEVQDPVPGSRAGPPPGDPG